MEHLNNFTMSMKEYADTVAYCILLICSDQSLNKINLWMDSLEKVPARVKHQIMKIYYKTLEELGDSNTDDETIFIKTISRCNFFN